MTLKCVWRRTLIVYSFPLSHFLNLPFSCYQLINKKNSFAVYNVCYCEKKKGKKKAESAIFQSCSVGTGTPVKRATYCCILSIAGMPNPPDTGDGLMGKCKKCQTELLSIYFKYNYLKVPHSSFFFKTITSVLCISVC